MKSQYIINKRMLMFNCPSAEEAIKKRHCNFVNKYINTENLLYSVLLM